MGPLRWRRRGMCHPVGDLAGSGCAAALTASAVVIGFSYLRGTGGEAPAARLVSPWPMAHVITTRAGPHDVCRAHRRAHRIAPVTGVILNDAKRGGGSGSPPGAVFSCSEQSGPSAGLLAPAVRRKDVAVPAG